MGRQRERCTGKTDQSGRRRIELGASRDTARPMAPTASGTSRPTAATSVALRTGLTITGGTRQ